MTETDGQTILGHMRPGEWITAKDLAARCGLPAMGMGARMRGLRDLGQVESRSTGDAPSPRSDAPPREWRLVSS